MDFFCKKVSIFFCGLLVNFIYLFLWGFWLWGEANTVGFGRGVGFGVVKEVEESGGAGGSGGGGGGCGGDGGLSGFFKFFFVFNFDLDFCWFSS